VRGQYRVEDGALPGVRAISSAGLLGINGTMLALHFSPDGKWLAGANRDRAVRIWQLAPGTNRFRIVKMFYDYDGGNVTSVRWSPDGRFLAVGDRRGRVLVRAFDPAHDLWDDATIEDFQNVPWRGIPYWMKTHLDAVSKDPVWMDDGHKVVWNVRWSPDGGRLAAVGTDGTLSVYDAQTGHVVHREHAKPLYGLDWSPDGRLLAAGSGDHQIYVYDAADGTPYDTLVGHDDLVTAVAWSPDGRTLASTAGGQLHSPALTSVVLGPDMNVRLWARE